MTGSRVGLPEVTERETALPVELGFMSAKPGRLSTLPPARRSRRSSRNSTRRFAWGSTRLYEFFSFLNNGSEKIAYAATGVASGETAAYTYWCVEKGYHSFLGSDREDPGWVRRARGWIRVVQTDVWVTLVILTCATLSFYFLGAGVLHRLGELPQGTQTIHVLSGMYTQTFGPWAYWLFSVGAFCILFSTVLSGIGAGSRSFPDLLVTFGFIDRQNLALRRKWITGYVIAMPTISTLIYMSYQRPIALIIVAASIGVFMLPIQSFLTLYLHLDVRVRPRQWIIWTVGLIFVIQCGLFVMVVRNLLVSL